MGAIIVPEPVVADATDPVFLSNKDSVLSYSLVANGQRHLLVLRCSDQRLLFAARSRVRAILALASQV